MSYRCVLQGSKPINFISAYTPILQVTDEENVNSYSTLILCG